MFAKDPIMNSGQFDMPKFFFLTHGNKQSAPWFMDRSSPAKPIAHQQGVCIFIHWAESEKTFTIKKSSRVNVNNKAHQQMVNMKYFKVSVKENIVNRWHLSF